MKADHSKIYSILKSKVARYVQHRKAPLPNVSSEPSKGKLTTLRFPVGPSPKKTRQSKASRSAKVSRKCMFGHGFVSVWHQESSGRAGNDPLEWKCASNGAKFGSCTPYRPGGRQRNVNKGAGGRIRCKRAGAFIRCRRLVQCNRVRNKRDWDTWRGING